jgi:hypothetical protein
MIAILSSTVHLSFDSVWARPGSSDLSGLVSKANLNSEERVGFRRQIVCRFPRPPDTISLTSKSNATALGFSLDNGALVFSIEGDWGDDGEAGLFGGASWAKIISRVMAWSLVRIPPMSDRQERISARYILRKT